MYGILCEKPSHFARTLFYALYNLILLDPDYLNLDLPEIFKECVNKGYLITENEEFPPDYSGIVFKFTSTFKFKSTNAIDREVVNTKTLLSEVRRAQLDQVAEALKKNPLESLNATAIRKLLRQGWDAKVAELKTRAEQKFTSDLEELYDEIKQEVKPQAFLSASFSNV